MARAAARLAAVGLWIFLAAACSERLQWRELRLPEASVMLPGRAQTVSRTVEFEGHALPMTMHSTGIGPSMFALGIAELPPTLAADTAAQERVIAFFSDGLVRNIGAGPAAKAPVTLVLPPGSNHRLRAGQSVQAQGRTADGRVAVLAARFFIVDDRLFQLVALGGADGVESQALDTFFSSFRPL
jgi:hypothetical protein